MNGVYWMDHWPVPTIETPHWRENTSGNCIGEKHESGKLKLKMPGGKNGNTISEPEEREKN